ncbi:lipase [Flexivirga endophytica]|uniref:Lipase n=1 Tax=Flexivirga endophytica TaxID=1849103 RepID=A0A916T950_9MICO|nr:lipase family protein [Flexivirga endophytica]GGB34573.1 lipase [Flexivirga endophytica]GHB42497.1 lipase [Flexivirga endophytica]
MSTSARTSGWSGQAEHTDERTTAPVPPAEDPFRRPPPGWETAAPGTPLRSRDVTVAFLGRIPLQAKAVQVLYRTADMHGDAATTCTTVLLADDAAPAEDRAILSFQCAIDSLAPEAFPSYTLRHRAPTTGEVVQLELLLIANALARGWAVSVPDHEGMQGNWGAPREAGHCALDGLRAARQHSGFGVTEQSAVTMWGYSGGGWATSWAAEMARDYAPELNVVGAVLGSPVGDPELVFRRANGHFFAGLAGLAIAGLIRSYPAMHALVDEHVDARGRALLDGAIVWRTRQAITRMAFTDFGKYMDVPVSAFLSKPEMQEVFADIRPGRGTPAMPLLVTQAVHDQIVPLGGIDRMVAGWVGRGVRVTYVRDRASEHFLLHIVSAPLVLGWLTDRISGVATSGSSTVTVRSVLAPLGRLASGIRLLKVCGRVLRGAPLSGGSAG